MSFFDSIDKSPHREYCRRQHRIIAQFLAIQAWIRKLDCIVLDRADLEAFLGLERIKSTRIKWLRNDIQSWFPYQQIYYWSGSQSSVGSMFLSRVPIDKYLPSGTMGDKIRISRMTKGAPKTEMYSRVRNGRCVPSQETIVAKLTLLSAGLTVPKKQGKVRKVAS